MKKRARYVLHEKSDAKKLRVGVLMGGKNAEREVSFNSGRTICDHLDTSRYEVVPIFQTEEGTLFKLPWKFLHRGKIADFVHRLETQATQITWDELKNTIDFVYIAQHGRFGEDGILQGVLEVLDIPYLGSKIFGSASGMDKAFHKKLLAGAGIKTPQGITLSRHEIETLSQEAIINKLEADALQLPYIVKPAHEGSSLGMSLVTSHDELMQALEHALISKSNNVEVLVEEKINGMEFVCVCLQNDDGSWFSLPITQVIPEAGTPFYDYEQKYMPGRAKKITPARCSGEILQKISKTCIKASELLEFKTISRIDGFVCNDGSIVLIDPNSLTGMGPATFLFHQAAQYGMNHTQLINFLIEQELKAYGLIDKLPLEHAVKEDAMNAAKKIRVGVLLGGDSNERETSLETGRNVCYKLSPQRYDVTPLFLYKSELYKLSPELLIKNSTSVIAELMTQDLKVAWSSLPENFDFIFNGLHGGKGENGAVQGMLEMLGLPYNGPGVLASALCMNKFKTNEFLKAQGFDVPSSVLITRTAWAQCAIENKKKLLLEEKTQDINFPLILKPYDDGCSVLVSKIKNVHELEQAINQFFENALDKDTVMLEELIIGMELTCGVIGNDEITVLPPSRAITKNDILTMKEKFLPGEGENQTPAPLPASSIAFVQETLAAVYRSLGCKGYSRIDCFYQDASQSSTGNERVIVLEVNTLPALTPATCIFHQAAEIGLRPMEFINKIIELGIENHRKISVTPSTELEQQDPPKPAAVEEEIQTVPTVEQPRPQAELRVTVPETMIIRMF